MSRLVLYTMLAMGAWRPFWAQSLAAPTSSLVSNRQVVVVGAGPVGLYFSALLLHRDPTVQIQILEQAPRDSNKKKSQKNAFGLGVGERMQNRLSDVPGLKEKAISVSAMVESLGIPLVSRQDLCEQMASFLESSTFPHSKQCRILYEESCQRVDFDSKRITTASGKTIPYDLLIAADGVNSRVRQQLVRERGFQEEHYVEQAHWKALQLPRQPTVEAGSFQSLSHPCGVQGRVLPRARGGHILLLFWRTGGNNPEGIETADDVKAMITGAFSQRRKSMSDMLFRLLGFRNSKQSASTEVVFDEDAVQDFVTSRCGQSHYLKLDQFHYGDSVALLGDSAHTMNSLLGQGCALGLQSASTLVEALCDGSSSGDLASALTEYTALARPEAHALTELSLVSYALRGGWRTRLAAALSLWRNALRGKGLIPRVRDVRIPFAQIAAENRRLLQQCRRAFEKQRLPFVPRQN